MNKDLNFFVSNRLENLIPDLIQSINTQKSNVFEKHIILVQSQGMSKWLKYNIADNSGIFSNIDFKFPIAFVLDIFKDFPDLEENLKLYSRENLTFKIMDVLPSLIEKEEFAGVNNFLCQENIKDIRLYELSSKLADLFDNYTVFRPDFIKQWEKDKLINEKSKEEKWQKILWNTITEKGKSRSEILPLISNLIKDKRLTEKNLPERVDIFGISTLPPVFLDIFCELSKIIQINFYLLNPCQHFWEDILSDREIAKKLKSHYELMEENSIVEEELYFDSRNPLLASYGTLGRDFFGLINDYVGENGHYEKFSYNHENKNLLEILQNQILNLSTEIPEGYKVEKTDESVKINSCYTKEREVEVLKDYMLDIMNKDQNIKPQDVLVMAPDIHKYSPHIHSVFQREESNKDKFIKYSISDLNVVSESSVIGLFFEILDLYFERYEATKIFRILENPIILNVLEISDDEMKVIFEYIRILNIRWGKDKEYRKNSLDLPEYSDFSWKQGLDRLISGYSLLTDEYKEYQGVFPYSDFEGENPIIFGKVYTFLNHIFEFLQGLSNQRDLKKWCEYFDGFIENIFGEIAQEERSVVFMKDFFHKTGFSDNSIFNKSGYKKEISFEVIRIFLLDNLKQQSFGRGFLNGAVTFSSMLPMRSIPFKVICLIGMGGDEYPRKNPVMSFDLIAQKRRLGDRNTRDSDKYIFLESIISSREKFYISYIGSSIKDNSDILPSIIVKEFIEYIQENFEFETSKIFKPVKHKLHSHNVEYFQDNTEFFTYNEKALKLSQIICESRKQKTGNRELGVEIREQENQRQNSETLLININDLINFFASPAKAYLKEKLGIYLEKQKEILKETDTFELDNLEKYFLNTEILEDLYLNLSLEEIEKRLRQESKLPTGVFGRYFMENSYNYLKEKLSKIREFTGNISSEKVDININVSDFTLFGEIENVFNEKVFDLREASLKPKDIFRTWIKFLILNFNRENICYNTYFLGKNSGVEFSSVPNSIIRIELENLVYMYIQGQEKPLSFFPKSSFAYAETDYNNKNGKKVKDPLKEANSSYQGNYNYVGEKEDLEIDFIYKDMDLDDISDFVHISSEILENVLKYKKDFDIENIIGGEDE